MPTTTPTTPVPGPRRTAAAGPSAARASIRLFAPDEVRPERCNSAPHRNGGCAARPVCRTTVTRTIRRLGHRDAESVIEHNACAAHGARFAAKHGLDADLPSASVAA